MKCFIFPALFLFAVQGPAAMAQRPTDYRSSVWVADLGNGTYKNPILYADYSDPDVVRVGADFYMTSSSFNCVPGLPILHSKDLVNWSLIGHALPIQYPEEVFDLPQHGKGVWAPAIRYHLGEFYIYYPDPDYGIYVVRARNPEGPWSRPALVVGGKGLIDPCPLWDEKGNGWLVNAWAASRAEVNSLLTIRRLSNDGLTASGDAKMVFDGHDHDPTLEGPKLYRRNGYYYIFAPAGGVTKGWQIALRSKNIYGPYEERKVMDQGTTMINGPHQGAWVETQTGESWFIHFQDRGAYGRVMHLEPLHWVHDWPVIGLDKDGDGKGEPVSVYKKPNTGVYPVVTPQESDEFDGDAPGPQWQWYANPRITWAAEIPGSGHLRLFAMKRPPGSKNLWDVPNLLLQKMPAPAFKATARLTLSVVQTGKMAGLLVMGSDYAYLGLQKEDSGFVLVQALCKNAGKGGKEEILARQLLAGNSVYCRVETSAPDALCRFSFSLDGRSFTPIGQPFYAKPEQWIGAKMGLFCLSPYESATGGYADVDWFRVRPPEEPDTVTGPIQRHLIVDWKAQGKPLRPIWAYFGYDEPNYTYMKDGKKLLGEIAALSPVPVYVRCHNLLTTGDGRPALKWGSTNAYTEDSLGRPVYDWHIVDSIFDTYVQRGMKPLAEIGFMPEALSTHPHPYRHYWKPGVQYDSVYTGWAYPSTDNKKWGGLIYQWVRHCLRRYGEKEVSTWLWEVWNEPNIGYWKGTQEEYFTIYDYAADAVKRALPSARVGGPATTGPRSERAADWLQRFLEHCAEGKNQATGAKGAPLDFISFHAKGSPKIVEGHVRMNRSPQLGDVARGFEIVKASAFKGLPLYITECDPEGCAACGMATNPENAYRNGTMYSSYTAASFARIYDLAERYDVDLEGAISWAFEFEGQKWFDGFRDLATNGIDKPVLNVFRMYGLMRGNRVNVENPGEIPLDSLLKGAVRSDEPDIHALATAGKSMASVMVWNYQDDDLPGEPAEITLTIKNVPSPAMSLQHYRIDDEHSNAYEAWKKMGSPQSVTDEQYAELEKSDKLELAEPVQHIKVSHGTAIVKFSLPTHGVSLLRLSVAH